MSEINDNFNKYMLKFKKLYNDSYQNHIKVSYKKNQSLIEENIKNERIIIKNGFFF